MRPKACISNRGLFFVCKICTMQLVCAAQLKACHIVSFVKAAEWNVHSFKNRTITPPTWCPSRLFITVSEPPQRHLNDNTHYIFSCFIFFVILFLFYSKVLQRVSKPFAQTLFYCLTTNFTFLSHYVLIWRPGCTNQIWHKQCIYLFRWSSQQRCIL